MGAGRVLIHRAQETRVVREGGPGKGQSQVRERVPHKMGKKTYQPDSFLCH